MGMLCGFLGCAATKIISTVGNFSLPIYLDSFVVGLIANIMALFIGSAFTQVTDEEKVRRDALFIVSASKDGVVVKQSIPCYTTDIIS